MFCIFGRCRKAASKFIDKKLENKNSALSKKVAKAATQESKQKLIDFHVNERFKVTQIRKCSHELSTPELANQLLELMKKEVIFSDLKLMRKQPKKLKSGKESVSKTTGKKLMQWVDLV